MTMTINPKFLRYSDAQLHDHIAMCQDVIAEKGPAAERSAELLAEYQAVLDARGGRTSNTGAGTAAEETTVGRQGGSPAANQYGTFAVHHASEKQVAFLRRLLDEKDTTGIKVPTTLEGISKTSASALIDKLLGKPNKAQAATSPGFRAASEKQVAFLTKLFAEKDWAGVVDGIDIDTQKAVPTLSSPQASKVIDALLSAPRKVVMADPADPTTKVAPGRYAVYGQDGTVDFYQIDRPTQGKWEGYTFIKLLVGSVGDFSETAVRGAAARTVAQKILDAGVEESARLFGQKTRHCGHCSSPLSNPQSRAAGYGDTCASKHGYWYPTLAEALALLGEEAE
jgi:hypothetical protein